MIIDEHGHAYNKIKRLEDPELTPGVVFPLLMPNAYLNERSIRAVFAGSNQAAFERDLNGTYTPCIRFVVPFTKDEATIFISVRKFAHSLEAHERVANFVPRQMVAFEEFKTEDAYVDTTQQQMHTKLMDDLHSQRQSPLLQTTLDDLFQLSSMSLGTTHLSFLDLGYVYRCRGLDNAIVAMPLCRPAQLALLQVWQAVSPNASLRLTDVLKSGDGFEDLAWRVLVARTVGKNGVLPCLPIGYKDTDNTSPLPAHFREVVVSRISDPNNIGKKQLTKELKGLTKRATSLQLGILYRCPDSCPMVDFLGFLPDGSHLAFQVSLSGLVTHAKGDKRPSLIQVKAWGLSMCRFIHITTKPEPHQQLLTQGHQDWKPFLSLLALIDANTWF